MIVDSLSQNHLMLFWALTRLLRLQKQLFFKICFQGLQRRATPHPSELKVMKKVIEERRNEAYSSRPDGDEESSDPQVHTIYIVERLLDQAC